MIAQHLETLGRHFRVAGSNWRSVAIAYDKRLTYQTAERLKIAIPRTFYPHSRAELEHVDCSFPVILKPAIKTLLTALDTRRPGWFTIARHCSIDMMWHQA
jgi:predicted ATP-grasp superfamily ATP-dependent carboligase